MKIYIKKNKEDFFYHKGHKGSHKVPQRSEFEFLNLCVTFVKTLETFVVKLLDYF
jgi:hypothetical protein